MEEALKGEDKAAIEEKTNTLMSASQKLGEKMYADAQAGSQAVPQAARVLARNMLRTARRPTTTSWTLKSRK